MFFLNKFIHWYFVYFPSHFSNPKPTTLVPLCLSMVFHFSFCALSSARGCVCERSCMGCAVFGLCRSSSSASHPLQHVAAPHTLSSFNRRCCCFCCGSTDEESGVRFVSFLFSPRCRHIIFTYADCSARRPLSRSLLCLSLLSPLLCQR